MARELGVLYVGVSCSKCGIHRDGRPVGDSLNRCMRCGRYADSPESFCFEHSVDETSLPSGYDSCPYCEEEARIRAEREHMQTRDRMTEPW